MTSYDWFWLVMTGFMTVYDWLWLVIMVYDCLWLVMIFYLWLWLFMTVLWLVMVVYDWFWLVITGFHWLELQLWLCVQIVLIHRIHGDLKVARLSKDQDDIQIISLLSWFVRYPELTVRMFVPSIHWSNLNIQLMHVWV